MFKIFYFLIIFFPCLLSAQPLEKISLQLNWKHQFQFAGFYAAKAKGYYQEAGLELEIKEYEHGIDISADVLNAITTYATASSQLILERLGGKKVVLLASYLKQNGLVLVTQPDIKQIADLKNKKVMVAEGELENTSLAAMLKQYDIRPEDIQQVPHTFNINDFVHAEVDAMSAFLSNQFYDLDRLEVEYRVINPAEYGNYSYDVELFTSEDVAFLHPQRNKKFVAATRRGWEYAFAHKEEIAELILAQYSQRKSKQALLYEADKIEQLFRRDIFQIGATSRELIELNAQLYVKIGLVDKDYDLNGYIFDSQSTLGHKSLIQLTAEEQEFIQKHPLITFSDVAWEPFAYVNDNDYGGYFEEYYGLIGKLTGLKFQFKKIADGNDFPAVLQALKNKQIDMIYDAAKNTRLQKYALFVGPLMQMPLAITSNQNNRYLSLAQLTNKTVALAKNSLASDYVRKYFPELKIIYTDDAIGALGLLEQNRVDAVLDTAEVVSFLVKVLQYQNLHIERVQGHDFKIYSLIRKDFEPLKNIIQKAINYINFSPFSTFPISQFNGLQERQEWRLKFDERNYLIEKKSLSVCVDPNWMPLEKIEEGKHIGIAADYLGLIAEKLDIPVVLNKQNSWQDALKAAQQRHCDLFSMAADTPSRSVYMDFTPPYLELPIVLSTSVDEPYIHNLHQLGREKVAIVEGYAFVDTIKALYPQLQIELVGSVQEGLNKVEKGEVYGYVDNLMSSSFYIQLYFTGTLKVSARLEHDIKLAIGSRNDQPILNQIIRKAMNQISADEKQAIINKWVSIKYDAPLNESMIIKVMIFFIVLLSIYFYRELTLRYYNKKLQTEVKKKIAELEHKNSMLLHQHKLASMGEMIANIAHQWRQPLASLNGIFTNLDYEYGQRNLSQRKMENYLNDAESLTAYMSSTIEDFSNFFAPDKEREQVDIRDLLIRAQAILGPSLEHRKIQLHMSGVESVYINAYPSELLQVILTLLNNAKDALINSDRINKQITILYYSTVDQTCIIVKDNAGGIPEEIINDIFYPYFSTKHKSKGTGLGLYIAKTVIEKNMGGKLRVQNDEEGAVFSILI